MASNLLKNIKLWRKNHHKTLDIEEDNKALKFVNMLEAYKIVLGITQFIIILFLILF